VIAVPCDNYANGPSPAYRSICECESIFTLFLVELSDLDFHACPFFFSGVDAFFLKIGLIFLFPLGVVWLLSVPIVNLKLSLDRLFHRLYGDVRVTMCCHDFLRPQSLENPAPARAGRPVLPPPSCLGLFLLTLFFKRRCLDYFEPSAAFFPFPLSALGFPYYQIFLDFTTRSDAASISTVRCPSLPPVVSHARPVVEVSRRFLRVPQRGTRAAFLLSRLFTVTGEFPVPFFPVFFGLLLCSGAKTILADDVPCADWRPLRLFLFSIFLSFNSHRSPSSFLALAGRF